MAKLILRCPAGFTYSGYQRCTVELVTQEDASSRVHANVSVHVGNLLKTYFAMIDNRDLLYVADDCFFIASGESFTLNDVAEILNDVFRFGIYFVEDGVEHPV